MADNPWKRQMVNNNAANPPPSQPVSSPVSSEPVNPWKAKQAAQQSQPGTPPVAPSTGPAWMKQPQQQSGGGNVAPWAKQAQQQSSPAADNPWKKPAFGASKIESIKQKKDREDKERLEKEAQEKLKLEQERLENQRLEQQRLEKERLQREEQQRLQRERLERERIARQEEQARIKAELKEKELRNEQRQLKVMAVEEALSIEREKQDKAELEARQKKNPKRAAPVKSKPAAISQVASPRSRPAQVFSSDRKSAPEVCAATEYLDSYQQLFLRYESYRERLDCQKSLLRTYTDFKSKVVRRFKELVDDHSTTQPRQLKVLDDNIQYQLALGTSRIEAGQTVYDVAPIKRLKYKMQLYDLLQNCLLALVKKIGVLKIRLPMVVLMEYRGVACVASAVMREESDEPPVDATKLREAANDFQLLEKEAKKICPKFSLGMLECRRLSYPQPDTIMLYVKDQPSRILEPRPAVKKQHLQSIDWLANPQLKTFSSSTENLKKLQSDPNLKQLVDCLLLAKSINTIYRSCQAEVQQLHLFNLMLRRDQGIWQLLRKLGHVQELPQRGLLLKLFEVYSGIRFDYSSTVFEEGLRGIRELLVKQFGYSFERLQFVQITNNYDRYVKDHKIELAGQSILLRYELAELKQNPQDRVNLVLDHVELLTLQEKHEQALEELLKIGEELSEWQPSRIRHLSLLFKTYSLLNNEPELLQTFQRLLRQINFNLGSENPLHVYLYSVLAYFYSGKRLTESVNLYQLALSVATKLYGANSEACGDINVDIAKTYLRNNKLDDADYHLEQAMRIYGENRPKTAQTLAVASKVHFLKKDVQAALQKIDKAIRICQKLDRSSELFELLRVKLGYLQEDATTRYKVIDAMLEVGINYNNRTLTKKAFEVALKEQLPKVNRAKRERLLDISHDQYASTQLLLGGQFELHRKNFPSVCELLRWALSLLETSNGQLAVQKGELIFSDVLSYFQEEQLAKLLA